MRALITVLSRHTIWLLSLLMMTSVGSHTNAASAINPEALKLVADFADRICKDIPLVSTGSDLVLSGNAKAELSGLIKKIAELGIGGTARYESSEYQGILQKDLATVLRTSMECKLEVLRSLKDGLIATSPGPTSTCKEAFSDEFDGGINPGWILEDPRNDARYNVAERPGFLRLSVPPCVPSKQCNDLFPGNNFDAPRFVQHINGDFTVVTRLDFDPHYQYQGAGILVWQDENNFLRLERSKGDVSNNRSGVHLDKREKGSYTAIPSTELQPTPATQVELRMKRAGDHFTASWREPGGIWRLVGETDIHLSGTKVGLALVAQHDVPKPTIADYDYFHVLCDSGP